MLCFKEMQLKYVYFLKILAHYFILKVLSCLLKSRHGASWCFCHRGPTWRLFLRPLLPKALLVTGFNFPCLQRPLCILLLRPACQEDFCSNVSHAHPHSHMHACVRMLVCAHSYGQRAEEKGCPGSREDAGCCKNTAYPAWKLWSYIWKLNP